jgi:hypothetical protein
LHENFSVGIFTIKIWNGQGTLRSRDRGSAVGGGDRRSERKLIEDSSKLKAGGWLSFEERMLPGHFGRLVSLFA